MARDRTHEAQAHSWTAQGRKTWARPVCRRLRAGLAESRPGVSVQDGTLETIGS